MDRFLATGYKLLIARTLASISNGRQPGSPFAFRSTTSVIRTVPTITPMRHQARFAPMIDVRLRVPTIPTLRSNLETKGR